MAILVAQSVLQGISGTPLTFYDDTDYGVDGNPSKSDYSNRTITLYSGLNPNVAINVPFPYTGTPDSTVDSITYAITEDASYASILTLTPDTGDDITSEITFCATQYTQNNFNQMLAQLRPNADGLNIAVAWNIALINGEIKGALARAQRGDIVQATNIINFAQNKSQELILTT